MKALIYAVEDEMAIKELYGYAFNNDSFECMCFENHIQFFDALRSRVCNIIILDIMLDGKDGFEILSELKSGDKYSDIPVIMVSAKGEEISKVKGLNLGADDYIAKPFGVLELTARINNQLRRTKKTSQSYSYGDVVVDDATHTISVCGQTVTATLKEYNLLKMLVKNSANVINREDIFVNVWGEEFFGETRTLDMHINQLRKKLQESGSETEITTVRGVGYMLK